MLKSILLSLLSFLFIGLYAQPKKYGCHQNHKHIKPVQLNAAQKSAVQNSILRSDTFDILNYAIHIDVTDYEGQSIKARTVIDIRPKIAGAEILRLDLLALTVDSIKQNGQSISFSHEPNVIEGLNLILNLDEATSIDDDFQIEVWYQGQPTQDPSWGGFYFESDIIYNLGIAITTIPPNAGKVWYPCFDTFVERATYDFHVMADGGFIPRCQGELISEELSGDTVSTYYRLSTPIPTYLTAIAASNYETIAYDHQGVNGAIPVELHAKTNQVEAMENRFSQLPQAIDALEYWFGPYIWNKVGYVTTTVGAMEHATNIAYPQGMYNQSLTPNTELISHELGHMWWGDITAPANYNQLWLKEGHAEYSQHLVQEWIGGDERLDVTVKDNLEYVLSTAHIDDDGYYPLSPMPDPVIYGRHTYYKGAAMVHNLRGYLGDSLFRAGTQAVLDTFYLGHMTSEQYRDELSEATGYDLTDFFDDHIFSPGFSTFVIDSVQTTTLSDGYETRLFLQQKLREAPSFHNNVPLDISFLDNDWNWHHENITVDGQFDEVIVITDELPLFWDLNVEQRLNQASLSYEAVLQEETSMQNLPWAEFRLKVESIGDSSLFRVNHHWVAPDQTNLDPSILEISSTHYWSVKGDISSGTHLESRVYYAGSQDYHLDYDLVSETESQIALVYRPDAHHAWSPYPWQTPSGNGSDNGVGSIKMDSLLMGDYAFANIESSVGIAENENGQFNIELYPNPAREIILIQTKEMNVHQVVIYDLQGKEVLRKRNPVLSQEEIAIELGDWPSGKYELVLVLENGESSSRSFVKH